MVHGRCSEVVKKTSPGLLRSPGIKNEDQLFARGYEYDHDETNEDIYFPEIIEKESHEDVVNPVMDAASHKLPDLSSKYRKYLKESSSDEFDVKHNKIPFDVSDNYYEFDQKLYVRDVDLDRNDHYDMFSNTANRSRSMLNRFNQNNNTTDSRVNSK